jgi:hypothetical protein
VESVGEGEARTSAMDDQDLRRYQMGKKSTRGILLELSLELTQNLSDY